MQPLVRGTAGIALALVLSAALPAAAAPTGVRTGRVDELMPAAEEGHIAWVENTRRRPGRRIVFAKPDGAPRFRVSGRGRAHWPGIDDGTSRSSFQAWA